MVPTPSPRVRLWNEHRRIALWVLLAGPLLVGGGVFALGLLVKGRPVLQLAAAPALLSGFVLLGVRRRLARRIRAEELGHPAPRWRRRGGFLLGLSAAVATALIWMFGHNIKPPLRLDGTTATWLTETVLGGVILGASLLFALFARFYGTTDRAVFSEARGIASWFIASAWTLGLTGLLLIVPAFFAASENTLHLIAHRVGEGVLGLILLELLVRGASKRSTSAPIETSLFGLRLIASRWNPLSSLFGTLTEAFGIDLRGTWSLRFIQRSIPPLGLGLVLLGWLGSSFTQVATDQVGVLETFGAPSDGELVQPGLTVHWPWPIQTVRRVSTGRVHTMPIGFVGEDNESSLLWTKRHAEEEYALLLGDGKDLVTVNAVLHYRVEDPRDFLYAVSDPVDLLSSAANRALMQETVGRTLEGVLSENIALLTSAVEQRTQADANDMGLGIEILDFTLIGLHPPLRVAQEYQAVVSAAIEKDTLVLEAETDRESALPAAKASARETLAEATAEASLRRGEAKGRALKYSSQIEAARTSRDFFMLRKETESKERQWRGIPLVVVDDRFESEGAKLRPVMSEAAPQGDIPREEDNQ